MRLAHLLPLACSWLPLACAESGAEQVDAFAPLAYIPSASCRLKTLEAWQDFLEVSANNPAWIKTCSDLDDCAATSGDFAAHVQADIWPIFSECQADLSNAPWLSACTERLRRFAPAWLRQHASDSYGFESSNAEYFAAQVTDQTPPGMMDPPAALLAALPSRAAIQAAAESHGWAQLTHDSCLGGVRTFIHVTEPRDRFEQWLLFGVDPEQPDVHAQDIVSFLAVQKQSANGEQLARVRLHFRDYVLEPDGDVWRLALPLKNDGKCYACHGSGARQLLPFPTSDELVALNARLAGYGVPNWNETIRAADYGPMLGDELGCTTCHDGKQRGPLTVFTSEGMLYQKVVAELSMGSFTGADTVPDWSSMQLLQRERQDAGSLSMEERATLEQARARHQADYERLMRSRLPALTNWLLDTRCDSPQPLTPHP